MEFSKIATDMNTKIENDEQMTVDVEIGLFIKASQAVGYPGPIA